MSHPEPEQVRLFYSLTGAGLIKDRLPGPRLLRPHRTDKESAKWCCHLTLAFTYSWCKAHRKFMQTPANQRPTFPFQQAMTAPVITATFPAKSRMVDLLSWERSSQTGYADGNAMASFLRETLEFNPNLWGLNQRIEHLGLRAFASTASNGLGGA